MLQPLDYTTRITLVLPSKSKHVGCLGNPALEQRGSGVGLNGNPLNLEVEANATC